MFRTVVPRHVAARLFIAFAAIGSGMISVAFAAGAEEAWKNLVMQALYAAGANDYAKSEQIFQRALHEAERFGPNDPRVGTTLNSLGLVYKAEKKWADAETAFRKALAVLEKAYGAESIDVANINFNIASVLGEEGKKPAALPLLQRTLATYQKQFGGQSLKAAGVLCLIGDSYGAMKLWGEAEAPVKQCAEIREANGGVLNAELGDALFSLAVIYEKQGKYDLANPRFRLAEKIREKTLGITSPAFAEVLESHSAMLRTMGHTEEANKDATLAAAIRRHGSKGP